MGSVVCQVIARKPLAREEVTVSGDREVSKFFSPKNNIVAWRDDFRVL